MPNIEIPLSPVLMFLLAFLRVLFFLSFLPIFGDLFTPLRVRILLAATAAFVFAPLLAPGVAVLPSTFGEFFALMASEALLGMALGFVGRVLFGAVQFAGGIMGEQIGFNMAGVMDPSQGTQVPIMAEILYIFALLLFFTSNSHHLFFGALARSFDQAPPGFLALTTDLAAFFSQKVSTMIWIAVQMSLPIIALIFAANVAMGMVAKAVPQLNVFLESFPIRIMAGLFLLAGTTGLLARHIAGMFSNSKADLLQVLSILAK